MNSICLRSRKIIFQFTASWYIVIDGFALVCECINLIYLLYLHFISFILKKQNRCNEIYFLKTRWFSYLIKVIMKDFYLSSENKIITFLTIVENNEKFYEQIPLLVNYYRRKFLMMVWCYSYSKKTFVVRKKI